MPALHQAFIDQALPILVANKQVLGVCLGGSYLHGGMDAESDLDFVIVVDSVELTLSSERFEIAESLGALLQAFTGEHVGEPRLIICLYGPPLLHVDLKFVTGEQLQTRVEDPVVLFDRHGVIPALYEKYPAEFPRPDPQWLEDRFWIWIHYAAGKLRRGEYMTAYTTIGFLIERVIVPLAMNQAGWRAMGARRMEQAELAEADRIRATCIALGTPEATRDALLETAEIYRRIRSETVVRSNAEGPAMEYLRES